MDIEQIKNELLKDREFREKLFKFYYKDDERFINKMLKEVSDDISNTSKN